MVSPSAAPGNRTRNKFFTDLPDDWGMFGIPAEALGLMAAAEIVIELAIAIAVSRWLSGRRRSQTLPAIDHLV